MKAEAAAFLPVGPLYKYLSLAPDLSPRWQDRLKQLINGKAFFPSAQDFNDPFDCLPVPGVPNSQEELDRSIDALIARLVAAVGHIPAAEAEDIARAGLIGKSPEEISKIARESMAITAASMGVFCLSENIHSVLMWSHYANNHRGIALIFETYAEPLRQGLPPFFRVNYQEERPILEGLFKPYGLANEITDALLVKAAFWKYEQEWRAFSPNGAHKVVEFDHAVITGIVFGANCSPEDEAWIRQVAVHRPMRYYRIIPDHRTFDLSLMAV